MTAEVDVKGTTPTSAEKELHDRLAQLGCICCRQEGIFNPVVSIHHCNGRTKTDCHRDVLPLCGPHHQKLDKNVLAVHGNKRAWEAKYGKQIDLVEQIMAEIGEPYVRPEYRERPVRKPRATPAVKVKVDRPKVVRPKREKQPPSAAQLKRIEDLKQQQKSRAAAARAVYEEENRERIEAAKASAKAYARDVRKQQSEQRKAQRKAQKERKAA